MHDIRETHRPLWQIAQDFLFVLLNLFGEPHEIAARHTYRRREWALIAKWLRAGEMLMRMLLALQAACLPKPPAARARRAHAPRPLAANAPARVSFRYFVSTSAAGSGRRRRKRQPEFGEDDTARFSAWPAAKRMEALWRVFEDPLPFARRLARRLHARPHRAPALLNHRIEQLPLIGEADCAKVYAVAAEAVRVFDTS